eukprot:1470646-Pyramimonas_sp.AAC.1
MGFPRVLGTRGSSDWVLLGVAPRAPVHVAGPLARTWFAHDLSDEFARLAAELATWLACLLLQS